MASATSVLASIDSVNSNGSSSSRFQDCDYQNKISVVVVDVCKLKLCSPTIRPFDASNRAALCVWMFGVLSAACCSDFPVFISALKKLTLQKKVVRWLSTPIRWGKCGPLDNIFTWLDSKILWILLNVSKFIKSKSKSALFQTVKRPFSPQKLMYFTLIHKQSGRGFRPALQRSTSTFTMIPHAIYTV